MGSLVTDDTDMVILKAGWVFRQSKYDLLYVYIHVVIHL